MAKIANPNYVSLGYFKTKFPDNKKVIEYCEAVRKNGLDNVLTYFGLNKLTLDSDSLLYYKNINDSIDSQIHKCADSLQTEQNRNLENSGAFYFHGEIIPKEQVFSQITLAREYYEKYK
ncbi:MAG: hypothetical protein MJ211_15085 [Bacteroidales bacterium]|nr:hypothetical protein [Bacteroidales bacterium]